MSDPHNTLLIVPPNDEEAYLIAELGEKHGYQVYRSEQPHGARLEREDGILDVVNSSGADTIIIIEMPGPIVEKQIKEMGKHLVIIDHHNYTDLERAYGPDGSVLPSSLEQFLKYADITPVRLKQWGYDPKKVKAVGLMDANYVWGLIEDGYSKEEVLSFLEYNDVLTKTVGRSESDPRVQEAAKKAVLNREKFEGYYVIESHDPTAHVRSAVSRLMALEFWQRTPTVISERMGKRLYVQETDRAVDLFHHFGGFTFGTDRNWGYDNDQEEERVSLADVKTFLSE
ncbi:MAG: hypothetical protein O2877_01555 [bacterium]|nr:hypothetical protein [bacterium]